MNGISNRAAAKLVGCSHVAIGKAIASGHLKAIPGGGIDPAELEKWNAGRRGARGGNPEPPVSISVTSPKNPALSRHARVAATMAAYGDDMDAETLRGVLTAEGIFLTRQDAELHRDSYIARSKQLAYEREAGKVVEVEHVAGIVGDCFARVRTRLLAIPAEQAPQLHRLKTVGELQDMLLEFITEALEDLVTAAAVMQGADAV